MFEEKETLKNLNNKYKTQFEDIKEKLLSFQDLNCKLSEQIKTLEGRNSNYKYQLSAVKNVIRDKNSEILSLKEELIAVEVFKNEKDKAYDLIKSLEDNLVQLKQEYELKTKKQRELEKSNTEIKLKCDEYFIENQLIKKENPHKAYIDMLNEKQKIIRRLEKENCILKNEIFKYDKEFEIMHTQSLLDSDTNIILNSNLDFKYDKNLHEDTEKLENEDNKLKDIEDFNRNSELRLSQSPVHGYNESAFYEMDGGKAFEKNEDENKNAENTNLENKEEEDENKEEKNLENDENKNHDLESNQDPDYEMDQLNMERDLNEENNPNDDENREAENNQVDPELKQDGEKNQEDELLKNDSQNIKNGEDENVNNVDILENEEVNDQINVSNKQEIHNNEEEVEKRAEEEKTDKIAYNDDNNIEHMEIINKSSNEVKNFDNALELNINANEENANKQEQEFEEKKNLENIEIENEDKPLEEKDEKFVEDLNME